MLALGRVGKPGTSAVPDFFEKTKAIEERHHHVCEHEIDGLRAGPQHTQRLKSYEIEGFDLAGGEFFASRMAQTKQQQSGGLRTVRDTDDFVLVA